MRLLMFLKLNMKQIVTMTVEELRNNFLHIIDTYVSDELLKLDFRTRVLTDADIGHHAKFYLYSLSPYLDCPTDEDNILLHGIAYCFT